MTELELYKFVTNNNIEWHEADNDGKTDIIMFVHFYHLKEFNKILGIGITDEAGISVVFKNGYLCFWMADICSYFDIEIYNVFKLN